MITPEPIGSHISSWGEGPIWQGNRLLYVDIEAHSPRLDSPPSAAFLTP